MRTTLNVEEDMGFQKAGDIVKTIRPNDTPSRIQSELNNNLTENSYIRILGPDGQTLYEVTDEKELAKKIKGKYVNTEESERRVIEIEDKEMQVLIVRVPLKDGPFLHASIEMGEEL